jgi:hypothetical protein
MNILGSIYLLKTQYRCFVLLSIFASVTKALSDAGGAYQPTVVVDKIRSKFISGKVITSSFNFRIVAKSLALCTYVAVPNEGSRYSSFK